MKRRKMQSCPAACCRQCGLSPDEDDDDFFYELLAEMRLPCTR